jgi:S1-C subfamily serine protease
MPDKTVRGIMGWGASGVIRGHTGRITSLSLGDYVLENVITNFPDAGDMHAITSSAAPEDNVRNGLLGVKILKRFHVVFDYANARVILEPNSDFSDPFTYNTTGLVPMPWANHAESLEVAYVIGASPAKMAGIEIGDRITAIDGQPVAAIGSDAIQKILEQAPGTSVTFTIFRGDEMMEKKLVLGELI